MNKPTSHLIYILCRLYNGEQLTSLDLGNIMSNPNQYFCKLKAMGLIGEWITTHGVKVHFILPKARKRAKALLEAYGKKQVNLFNYKTDGLNAIKKAKRSY
ncbi:MAG: hypothetical protein LBJ88_04335 [Campylobacteraceae bacterium]|jgi:hypothetical protein|nr:hypothetical protein [Campylobacteraceae bacterium]